MPRASQSARTGGAGEEQQGDEAQVHGLLRDVAMLRMPAPVEPPQAGGADEQADATDHAKHFGQAGQLVRRDPAEHVVVDRGHAGGREAEQEAVEGEVVEVAAGLRPGVAPRCCSLRRGRRRGR